MSLPDGTDTLKVTMLPKPPGGGARLKGLGIVISIAIAAAAIFALTHTLKNVAYNEVLEVVRHTNAGLIALARPSRRCSHRPPASSHAAISARSSPVISVTLPGGIAFDHAALRPIRRALRRI